MVRAIDRGVYSKSKIWKPIELSYLLVTPMRDQQRHTIITPECYVTKLHAWQ
jgi:hypothetical protein